MCDVLKRGWGELTSADTQANASNAAPEPNRIPGNRTVCR